VKWALAEEAWGGRPAWDSLKADTSFKYAEYVPPDPRHQQKIMQAWSTKNAHEDAVTRHGVQFVDWRHDCVSRVGVRNEYASKMARLEGRRLPAATAPEGHPRLRASDRGAMINLPIDGAEDELQTYWELEII